MHELLTPNAVRHLDVLVSVNLEGQLELAVEASLGEDAFQEGVEKTLVKLVVDATTVDGQGHQGLQCRPGDLVWSDILTTLCVCVRVCVGEKCNVIFMLSKLLHLSPLSG